MTINEYYKWLKKEWSKVGLILSIFLFTILFVIVRKYDFIIFVLLLHTPLYMLHQTEEYVFPGGFPEFFTTKIFNLKKEDTLLSENFIFFVNIPLVWIILPFFALLSIINYQYGLWIPYFSLFAGVAHIVLAIKAKKIYNPGLAVSLFLNIPVGLWSIIYLKNAGIINNLFLNLHMWIGLGINAALPVLGVLLYKNYRKRQEKRVSKTHIYTGS